MPSCKALVELISHGDGSERVDLQRTLRKKASRRGESRGYPIAPDIYDAFTVSKQIFVCG